MYNIDAEILEKYGMSPYEEFYNSWRDELTEAQIKELYCHTFLQQTDYISLKILEGSLSTSDCREELEIRELARKELTELKGKNYIPKTLKNVEERTTDVDNDPSRIFNEM